MADTAKATKKATKPKQPAAHPKYSEMVKAAISSLKERGGSSRQAILKYIMANFNVGADAKIVNSHLKLALKNGVKNSALKQSKGTGASGSFKIGEKPKVEKPKKAKKPKAAKPKKPKTPTKKAKTPKKTGEKKTAKPKKAKTPKKKADKPKKAKTPTKKAKTAAKPKKTPTKKAAKAKK